MFSLNFFHWGFSRRNWAKHRQHQWLWEKSVQESCCISCWVKGFSEAVTDYADHEAVHEEVKAMWKTFSWKILRCWLGENSAILRNSSWRMWSCSFQLYFSWDQFSCKAYRSCQWWCWSGEIIAMWGNFSWRVSSLRVSSWRLWRCSRLISFRKRNRKRRCMSMVNCCIAFVMTAPWKERKNE